MGIYPCGKPNRAVHVPHMHSPACSGNFHLTSTCCAAATGSVSQATTFLIRIPLRTPALARFTATPVPTFQLPSSPDSLPVPPLLPAGNPEGSVCPGFKCLTVSLPLVHASRAHVLFLRLATRRFGWCVPPLKDLVARFSGLSLRFQIQSSCSTVEDHCYFPTRDLPNGFSVILVS